MGDGSVIDSPLPRVSLLISVYNEETVIDNKIRNALSMDYQKDLLEIVVVSDGSTDRTDEIVTQYATEGVVLRSYPGRIGKTECLNRAVPLAHGEIIVFSDANSEYDKYAIREMVRHFNKGSVGFVTGATRYLSGEGDHLRESIEIYSKIEHITKRLESVFGSCVGADGAIFSTRKSLYRRLNPYDINDLVTPFLIIKQRFQGIFEGRAWCFEKTAKDVRGEFSRQVRITNRTIRAIVNNRELLNPFRYGFFSFALFSHKICKLLTPFFLLFMLFSSAVLIPQGLFYGLMFAGQVLFYSLAGAAFLSHWGFSRFASIPKTFTASNFAIVIGWLKYFRGDTHTTWTTVR